MKENINERYWSNLDCSRLFVHGSRGTFRHRLRFVPTGVCWSSFRTRCLARFSAIPEDVRWRSCIAACRTIHVYNQVRRNECLKKIGCYNVLFVFSSTDTRRALQERSQRHYWKIFVEGILPTIPSKLPTMKFHIGIN